MDARSLFRSRQRHISYRRRSARSPSWLWNHAPGGRRRVGRAADPVEARRVLRRAVELGVTLIDTADAYGPEIAERLIGERWRRMRLAQRINNRHRHQGRNYSPGSGKDRVRGPAGYLIQCVEMSLRRLKLERIDLYHFIASTADAA